MSIRRLLTTASFCLAIFAAGPAWSQAVYDPASAIKPAPNVMLLLDATRTTSINGQTCRGLCHTESACGGEEDCSIYGRGETRLQLARRVLTGGYGWNTPVIGPDGRSADSRVRKDGVMDAYPVRWGVTFYDGLSTRLALDPTENADEAQRAVIDFGQLPNDAFGPAGDPNLNSFTVYPRTTQCCGNFKATLPWSPNLPRALPWFDEAVSANARQSRALQWVRDYWDPRVAASQWTPGSGAGQAPAFFAAGRAPKDTVVIDSDPTNVLAGGAHTCRRNFTIMMLDGHGGAATDTFAGLNNGEAAAGIYNVADASGVALPPEKRNQVFAIHFGVQDKINADRVADYGFDGVPGGSGPTTAFAGAPGGRVDDLSAMLAAFSSIFSLVFAGNYVGAAPTVTRLGDAVASTHFTIRSCQGLAPDQCNIGRDGHLEWRTLATDGSPQALVWDAGAILRTRHSADRNLYTTTATLTSGAASEVNCGSQASCAVSTAAMSPLDSAVFGPAGAFMRGEPTSTFANGVQRGDSDGDGVVDDPAKLGSISGSRPVVVAAPPGVGRDVQRWLAFRTREVPRVARHGGAGDGIRISGRDRMLYVGANDGFLHAFLVGRALDPNLPTPSYVPWGQSCNVDVGPSQQGSQPCDGHELWAFSPRMLHKRWADARGGHPDLMAATPVVADVLFTKAQTSPGPVCSTYPCSPSSWEYRTVLLQCLGSGGPGCFALDVSNPWSPELLWEREFLQVPGKSSSTSRPVIGRVRKVVGSTSIPYFVGLMGGGQNEVGVGGRKGTFIAVGLEDGAVFTTPPAIAAEADFAGEPSCLDADGDDYVDTCYVATTVGSIYKVRLPGGDPTSMTMTKLFDARDASASGDPSVRVFTKVIATPQADGSLALFFGSGDIEAVSTAGSQNYVFKIRDREPTGMPTWTPAFNASLLTGACAAPSASLSAVNDGVLALPAGEKVLFDPALVQGTLSFTTYAPDSNLCIEGKSYLYGLRFDTCGHGLDTTADGVADTTRTELGAGVSSGVSVDYRRGGLYTAATAAPVRMSPAKAPVRGGPRIEKLFWRENL